MTLLEHFAALLKAEKTTPGAREVRIRLGVILARMKIVREAQDDYLGGKTKVIEFPFSEVQKTSSLIDELIPIAFENLDIPYALVISLRDLQRVLKRAIFIKALFDARSARADAIVNRFLTGTRPNKIYQVMQGDMLEGIAQKFLLDFRRWPEIVELNNLDFPFIVTEEGIAPPAGKNIATIGTVLVLPQDARDVGNDVITQRPASLESLLGVDVALNDKMLTLDDGGDLALIGGAGNLLQATRHRLITSRGEVPLHPEYGSTLDLFIGQEANSFTVAMCGIDAWRSLTQEPRFTRIDNVKTTFLASVLDIHFDAFVIGEETPSPFNLVINL